MSSRKASTLSLGALLAAAITVPAGAQCTGFNLTASGGAAIVPGTTSIGSSCDDCTTPLPLPFPVTLYGVAYNSAVVSSNGTLQFTTNSASYTNACLPQTGTLGVALIPYWDDLRTDGTGNGVFTSVSGTAPGRVFNIEWRAVHFSGGAPANFEVRLFEDSSRVEYIYASGTGDSATIGAQHTSYPHIQYGCNSGGLAAGTKLTLTCTSGSIPPTGQGAATPNSIYTCGPGGNTLLTVTVTGGFNPTSTGITVTGNCSSIGGAAAQVFYNDGTNGDAVAGDNIFSYRATVPDTVSSGAKSIQFSVNDAEDRSSAGTMGLTVSACPTGGPDVFVARHTDIGYYGSVGNITAYAIGTDACNNGDVPVIWIQNGVQHPVIAQNFYRLKDGRFEQVGQSWLKHGFSSTNSGTCGTCTQPPMGSQQLGVNCSDAYGSGLNGGQSYLGPRSEVNPTTGAYVWPHGSGTTGTIGMRLQVKTADIDPAQNTGARYFGETHYVTADDARFNNGVDPATNGLNNASYQEIRFNNTTSAPTLLNPIQRMSPAIRAWKDLDPDVTLVPADYIDTTLGTPGIVARFWVAAKATDNGDGTWHYEYAVYNMNADRAAGGFTVPIGAGVNVTNTGFSGTFAHSGEPYPNTATDNDPWPATVSDGSVTWATDPYLPPAGFGSNALRWGTLYNFRFDADTAPTNGDGTLTLFKPGAVPSISAADLPVPSSGTCPADFNQDGGVDGSDVEAFYSLWENGDSGADFNQDGGVDGADVEAFFLRWEAGC